MWLKLLGSVLVITAGTLAGFSAAHRYSERPRQVRHVIGCLAALKSYINYVAMPLPSALKKCTDGIEGPVAALFSRTGTLLAENGWMTPEEAIKAAMEEMGAALAFDGPEKEALYVLGANLGQMNRQEQDEHLRLVQEQLAAIEAEAARMRDQNVKMCRYLGICGSMMVVILLI